MEKFEIRLLREVKVDLTNLIILRVLPIIGKSKFYDHGEMLIEVFGLNACIGDEKRHKIILSLCYSIFTVRRCVSDSCHL